MEFGWPHGVWGVGRFGKRAKVSLPPRRGNGRIDPAVSITPGILRVRPPSRPAARRGGFWARLPCMVCHLDWPDPNGLGLANPIQRERQRWKPERRGFILTQGGRRRGGNVHMADGAFPGSCKSCVIFKSVSIRAQTPLGLATTAGQRARGRPLRPRNFGCEVRAFTATPGRPSGYTPCLRLVRASVSHVRSTRGIPPP